MGKRRIIAARIVLVYLAILVVCLWLVLDWPPPRLILRFGIPPEAPTATGRTWTNSLRMEFIEFEGRGYYRAPPGRRPRRPWIEMTAPVWVSRRYVERCVYQMYERDSECDPGSGGREARARGFLSSAGIDRTESEFCEWLTRRCGGCQGSCRLEPSCYAASPAASLKLSEGLSTTLSM